MTYTVSITSQGQISIPIQLRRELGLDKTKKAMVSKQGNSLIVEPIPDLLSLRGSLQDKAIKGKTIDEIIVLEEEAAAQGFIEHYKRKLDR